MERKLEEALLMRQEAEAKQVLAEKALQDYMSGGGDMGKVSVVTQEKYRMHIPECLLLLTNRNSARWF